MLTSLVLLVMGWVVTAWYAKTQHARAEALELEIKYMRVKRVSDIAYHFSLGEKAGKANAERVN